MHSFVPPADGADNRIDPSHTEAIKRWTTEILRLPDDAVVTVQVVACADPGCPLVESQVIVLTEQAPPRRWRFTRPRAAITRLLLSQVLGSASVHGPSEQSINDPAGA